MTTLSPSQNEHGELRPPVVVRSADGPQHGVGIGSSSSDARQLRQLRLEIARLRRRIDRRVRAVQREGRRLVRWRTYVERYPAHVLVAGLGLGAMFGAGLGRVNWTRLVAGRIAGRSVDKLVELVAEEFHRAWAASRPGRTRGRTGGGQDG
ncbi:MAG TPA: hypothetical protein EYP56_16520 [Planctomycetaceae bacterium]|nr:hypothetical protein [Planctomycetaceae bacterium]